MPDKENEKKYRELLQAAEEQILDLRDQVQAHAENNLLLMDSQKAEAEQMVQLTEQIWSLEEALAATSAEKDEVLSHLSQLRGTIESIQHHVTHTLEAASKNATRLELAARVYEISSIADDEEDDDEVGYKQEADDFFKELKGKVKM